MRDGKKASTLKGPLISYYMKQAPADASILVMGNVPKQLHRTLTRALNVFSPSKFLLAGTIGKTLDCRFEGGFADAEEAKVLVQQVNELKTKSLEALKAPGLPLKADTIAFLRKTLESVKLEADGASVKGGFQAPDGVETALRELFGEFLRSSAPLPPPPPPLQRELQPIPKSN